MKKWHVTECTKLTDFSAAETCKKKATIKNGGGGGGGGGVRHVDALRAWA